MQVLTGKAPTQSTAVVAAVAEAWVLQVVQAVPACKQAALEALREPA